MVDDRHPVTELIRLLHVVGREQDRLPVGMELAHDVPQGQPALRVEPGRRLVEEQHLGRCMIALATISRWAMPPERAMTDMSARSLSRTRSSISRATRLASFVVMPK